MKSNAAKTVILIPLLLAAAGLAAAQDRPFDAPPSLFSDKRAFKPYDVVTILLMEYTSASNEARTDSDMRHMFEADSKTTGWLDFIPGLGLDAGIDSEQRARGTTSRQGSLRGKISARVVEMLPNGDLRLEGQRTVEINGEEQIIVLSGVVRPSDIRADNTVYSYLIADASITYRGRGMVNDVVRPGILSRLIGWIF